MDAKRILVVDDDHDLVETTKTFLESRGYAVSTAHSGLEARDEIARQRPDLVVLDIMMDSDTDGFNLAFSLRDETEADRIPRDHRQRLHQGAQDQDPRLRAAHVRRVARRQVLREAGQARPSWPRRSPVCWPAATAHRSPAVTRPA